MYINTSTGQYPITEQQIRESFPNTSFPALFEAPEPYAWVFPTPMPSYNQITQIVSEGTPVLTNKGHWEQTWNVTNLPLEVAEANAEALRISKIPASVSPRQIRQALTRASLRAAVEAAVAAGDQDIKDWWEFATEVQRNNVHVIEMGTALGVTERQLDDLFTLAGTL